MIRIYSQYSYGGYRTFFLKGEQEEEVVNEVTTEDSFNFPSDAHLFFQYGGVKLAYMQLSNGEYALILREIPSIHTDSDGRAIPCALQFIGEDEDRNALDNLTLLIADDLNGFEIFFSHLFYVRNGLHFHGDQLREYIDRCYETIVPIGEVHTALKKIEHTSEKVRFLVPLSKKFGVDREVTLRTKKELHLENVKNYLSISELIKIQRQAKFQISPAPVNHVDIGQTYSNYNRTTSTHEQKDGVIELLKAENQKLAEQNKQNFCYLKEKDKQLNEKKDLVNSLLKQNNKKNRTIMALVALNVVLAILSLILSLKKC